MPGFTYKTYPGILLFLNEECPDLHIKRIRAFFFF